MERVAAIVIGRNEGVRLPASLTSVRGKAGAVLYVDSASSDGSVKCAGDLGIEVLSLGEEGPLTAARARNAGFGHLRGTRPEAEFVQFVDGDSRIATDWIAQAVEFLDSRPEVAVVAGRVREVDRNASIYNRLCDLEWSGPVGDVRSVGGIFMVRASVFATAGGFDPKVIAGEEAELCARITGAGHRVHRLAVEMAGHDAAMSRFSQWWKRAKRSGHAYAEAAARGSRPDARQLRSFLLWGLLVPVVATGSAAAAVAYPSFAALTLLALIGYVALFSRVARFRRGLGDTPSDSRLYATFCLLGKFPQVIGFLAYTLNRMRGRRTRLMEHKPVNAAGRGGERNR